MDLYDYNFVINCFYDGYLIPTTLEEEFEEEGYFGI